jgi:hypothetical protein
MRLHPHEFIRRFLMHVLPKGFHRIHHYGLFANANRAENIATARALLNVAPPAADPQEPRRVLREGSNNGATAPADEHQLAIGGLPLSEDRLSRREAARRIISS